MDEIDIWVGRMLTIAGAILLVEAIVSNPVTGVSGISLPWLLKLIPFGIVFVLSPFMFLRSYRYLVNRTPVTAYIAILLVVIPPICTIIFAIWGILSQIIIFIPAVTIVPVKTGMILNGLIVSFALGIVAFGLSFLRYDRARPLGVVLLIFVLGFAIPLFVVNVFGIYIDWLTSVLLVSVALSLIGIGYYYPPTERNQLIESLKI